VSGFNSEYHRSRAQPFNALEASSQTCRAKKGLEDAAPRPVRSHRAEASAGRASAGGGEDAGGGVGASDLGIQACLGVVASSRQTRDQ
jgi:hypothetical protein